MEVTLRDTDRSAMLASIELLQDRIVDSTVYPFQLPVIQSLRRLNFSLARITFFVGENGSGKSTLLEAIALNYGLSLQGGNRNFAFQAEIPTDDTYPLSRAIRLGFRPARTGEGFFFRAETLWNLATKMDEMDEDPGIDGLINQTFSAANLFTNVLTVKLSLPCSTISSDGPASSFLMNPKPLSRFSASWLFWS